jgi:anthranilate phosphoribosyltransferase
MLRSYTITPEEVGLPHAQLADLKGGTAAENAVMLRDILDGKVSPVFNAVLLNTSAALLAAGRVETLADGVRLARGAIGTGRALRALDELVRLTGSFV